MHGLICGSLYVTSAFLVNIYDQYFVISVSIIWNGFNFIFVPFNRFQGRGTLLEVPVSKLINGHYKYLILERYREKI